MSAAAPPVTINISADRAREPENFIEAEAMFKLEGRVAVGNLQARPNGKLMYSGRLPLAALKHLGLRIEKFIPNAKQRVQMAQSNKPINQFFSLSQKVSDELYAMIVEAAPPGQTLPKAFVAEVCSF